jgi:cytochrome c553
MKTVIVAVLAASLSAGVMAAGDAAAGKAKAAACAGCHGQNGKAMVPNYPSLAGQNAAYIEGALKAYKTQERKGYQAAIMYGMAAALSDQDMANLAAYYASL